MHTALALVLGAAGATAALVPVARALVRRAELRARQAERRARGAQRLAELGSMTSGLAHEIKNPLSTILLNGQIVAESIEEAPFEHADRERLLRRVNTLVHEVERLRDILTDFLRFAGRMELVREEVDLAEIVGELTDFFHPQCDQGGVVLRTSLPEAALRLDVDANLLKQAILNLLINAVQAMEGSGRRELMVRLEETHDGCRIRVADTGPGIEPDRLDAIFHPYVSGRAGGTGLGLATTRRIAEEHGGRLLVTSTPGQGSEFVVELPRTPVEPDAADP